MKSSLGKATKATKDKADKKASTLMKKKSSDKAKISHLKEKSKSRRVSFSSDGDAGETDKKKRKKNDQKDGATGSMKSSLGKTTKATKDKADKKASTLMKKKSSDKAKVSHLKEKSKSRRVSFSSDVEVFPPCTDSDVEEYDKKNLVRGKRFSKEEDQLIRDAVYKYIEINQLGEDGLQMVLKCGKHPQVRDCWKEICADIPWRPRIAVYGRAHTIFERSEKRGFSKEESEIIRKFHAENGPQWKKLSEVIGRQRMHIKDEWRRIRLPNAKNGRWSQEEYQNLFDLVNLDLRLKAFEERISSNTMIRENISWEAISDKLSTRSMATCCHKWYDQLTSPLVRQGVWADSDDYLLLDALQRQHGCNVEDVDWDNLLEHRCGEVCKKRWEEMVRHIGGYKERSFLEQVDVLTKRYCADMVRYRFKRKDNEEESEEESEEEEE